MKRGVRISTTKELMKVFAVLILVLAFGTLVAQQFDMNRAEWLKNLGPIMANGFCNGCGSHFMRIYKGVPSKCVAEVGDLFDRCANKEPRVMLPERLTGLAFLLITRVERRLIHIRLRRPCMICIRLRSAEFARSCQNQPRRIAEGNRKWARILAHMRLCRGIE